MVAHALDNCRCAGVADTETLACNAVYICLAASGTVKRNVTDNNIFLCLKVYSLRRIYDQLAAG